VASLNGVRRFFSNAWELSHRWNFFVRKNSLHAKLGSACAELGFEKIYFTLSFDCDTSQDAAVVCKVIDRLRSLRVTPTFAVPAELLEENKAQYTIVRDAGCPFINHGYQRHTEYDSSTGAYVGTLFYHDVPRDKVRSDIIRAHDYLTNFLGNAPTGFRSPHFGTFQNLDQRTWLHQTLGEFGYRYSSSTLPVFAFEYGPIFKVNGRNGISVLEIPVTGGISNPFRILDTWKYFVLEKNNAGPQQFLAEIRGLVEFYQSRNLPGYINIYGDPSQIHEAEEFFQAIAVLAQNGTSATFDEIIAKTKYR